MNILSSWDFSVFNVVINIISLTISLCHCSFFFDIVTSLEYKSICNNIPNVNDTLRRAQIHQKVSFYKYSLIECIKIKYKLLGMRKCVSLKYILGKKEKWRGKRSIQLVTSTNFKKLHLWCRDVFVPMASWVTVTCVKAPFMR